MFYVFLSALQRKFYIFLWTIHLSFTFYFFLWAFHKQEVLFFCELFTVRMFYFFLWAVHKQEVLFSSGQYRQEALFSSGHYRQEVLFPLGTTDRKLISSGHSTVRIFYVLNLGFPQTGSFVQLLNPQSGTFMFSCGLSTVRMFYVFLWDFHRTDVLVSSGLSTDRRFCFPLGYPRTGSFTISSALSTDRILYVFLWAPSLSGSPCYQDECPAAFSVDLSLFVPSPCECMVTVGVTL